MRAAPSTPASDGDGNPTLGGGSAQDGYTQDGSYDEPNGPSRLNASPFESSGTGSKGFGGAGPYSEPSSPAVSNMRAAPSTPASDGDGNPTLGGGSAQDGYTQ